VRRSPIQSSLGKATTPNTITALGIQDRGEIMRRNWNAGALAASNSRKRPHSETERHAHRERQAEPDRHAAQADQDVQVNVGAGGEPRNRREGRDRREAPQETRRRGEEFRSDPPHEQQRTKATQAQEQPKVPLYGGWASSMAGTRRGSMGLPRGADAVLKEQVPEESRVAA
jgi:hypothetical protein